MNPKIDLYLSDGCGRCDLYQTTECKVHLWPEELKALRAILLTTDLKEDLKWSMPTYTFQNKNVLILSAFKNYASLNFFKGSLLKDPQQLLENAGPNSREAKLFKFYDTKKIVEQEGAIRDFIKQAIELEKSGAKVEKVKQEDLVLPEVLLAAFKEDAGLEAAFRALTPGRQRGYVITISGAKQAKTRVARIEKWKSHILMGKGIHDR
mgnify:CR=1 FL=1